MKAAKKIISVLLSICILALTVLPVLATDEETAKKNATQYPYILVHGMLGYGENDEGDNAYPYWGFSEDKDVVAYMRSQGLEAYAPSVGKLSSAWDRACELYAQLTGTRVDYGAAHAAKYGHARYGRNYTGRGIMNGKAWDMKTKINLITHSFGGPTCSLFLSIMEYGAQEEIEADPYGCSDFFKGGKGDLIYSVSELASPHNGSPVSDFIRNLFFPVVAICFMINIEGTKAEPTTDYMIDQWGITADPYTGETAELNPIACLKLAVSKDHACYDMTLKGAQELNEKCKVVDSVYYFSYPCDMTEDGEFGIRLPVEDQRYSGLGPMSFFNTVYSVLVAGPEWAANDGLVPVESGLYPYTSEDNHADYVEGMDVEPGIWYVMPIPAASNHGYHVGGDAETLYGFYDELTARIAAIDA